MLGNLVLGAESAQPVERFLGLDGLDLAVVGAFLGLGALALAFGQLIRTQNALRASRDAMENTKESLAVFQLLTLIPHLHRLETELEDAAADNDKKTARRLLASWRSTAGEIQGVLVGHPADWALRHSGQDGKEGASRWRKRWSVHQSEAVVPSETPTQLEEVLRQSTAQATLAKASLLNDPSTTSCKQATEAARAAIAAVCETANVFGATLRTYAVRDDHV